MSVDIYAAVSAALWPSQTSIQACIEEHHFPVQLKRWPILDTKRASDEVALAVVDGNVEAYLEGAVAPSPLLGDEAAMINGRIGAMNGGFRIEDGDALVAIRARSPNEMRAASFVVASLIVCFHGYGFEPQGNTNGRAEFAANLVRDAESLRGMQ